MARHHAADARGESVHVGDGGRVQQLVLKQQKHEDSFTSSLERERSDPVSKKAAGVKAQVCVCVCVLLTGIFFCVTTTTLSLPLTPTDVSPPWEMALKAYSARKRRKNVDVRVSAPTRICERLEVTFNPQETHLKNSLEIIQYTQPLNGGFRCRFSKVWKPNCGSVLSAANAHRCGTTNAS